MQHLSAEDGAPEHLGFTSTCAEHLPLYVQKTVAYGVRICTAVYVGSDRPCDLSKYRIYQVCFGSGDLAPGMWYWLWTSCERSWSLRCCLSPMLWKRLRRPGDCPLGGAFGARLAFVNLGAPSAPCNQRTAQRTGSKYNVEYAYRAQRTEKRTAYC
jgi:hypothetical protein